jgi:diguanylate cyclase (GGDEF)-like protein
MELSGENLDRLMRRMPDLVLFGIGLAIISGITAFKLTLGQTIPLIDFLLVPVVWVGWFARARWYGYVLALVAAVLSAVLAVVGMTHASLGAASASALARLALYLVILGLLGMMRRERAAHQHAATTDQLTGAANGRLLSDMMQAELARSQRYDHEISLAFVDVDDFKAINDGFGHAEGDHVLRQVSHVMRSTVRGVDVVARIGGDEFAVLMPETGASAAREVLRRMNPELARITLPDRTVVGFSVGLVTFDTPAASVREILVAADQLMYRAKQAGKGHIEQAERRGAFRPERPNGHHSSERVTETLATP